eukprot:TRINITY_DN1388_c0_g1_i2.p1 TRINITY_DN1388_c0_g1~~TRINITY_DN1388_c0_g1_i2.p1  ORF type:complete len:578 (-),score=237.98 TRINITY_DN1388_c0_g1_i2:752-2485(-)
MKIVDIATTPYEGQKPGTSGLRKKTKVFQQENYTENFVQAVFDALPEGEYVGQTIAIGGDGRFFSNEAVQIITKIAAANGVARVWIGQDTLLSTPAVSAVIREREDGICAGGFILTASHNPGGPEEDFGIKYNVRTGGPAQESLTQKVFEITQVMTNYKMAVLPEIDVSKTGVYDFDGFVVEVIDSVEDYMNLLKSVFDFDALRTLIARDDFKMIFDGLSGVAGPYAVRMLVKELGLKEESLVNCIPLNDFGGHHPDPNLTYAKALVKICGLTREGTLLDATGDEPEFGAACDGDADRNMILGNRFFVTPSDSVAVIAANAQESIPFFKDGLRALARSMPTSGALDEVAKDMGVKFFEVPTGWKFFGNLMDSKAIFDKEDFCPLICGEESFGTGSSHIREKDGLWAVLAWLSILAKRNESSEKLVSIQDIVEQHWAKYGRHFYCRYDYEGVAGTQADALMDHLRGIIAQFAEAKSLSMGDFTICNADEFCYVDPVDGSISRRQGIRFNCTDGSRVVFRLSGTGSSGATIRMYLEKHEREASLLGRTVQQALGETVKFALELCKMEELTGRKEPTVIT